MDREWYGVYTKRFVCLLLSKSVCLFSLSLYSSFFFKVFSCLCFCLFVGWMDLARTAGACPGCDRRERW